MLERYSKKQRSKVKAATARPEKGKPNKGLSKGGSSIRVTKKAKVEKFCQKCKTYGGAHQTHNTTECCRLDNDVSPLDSMEVSRPRNISLTKRMGVRMGWRI